MKYIKVIGATNALTDILIPITEKESKDIGINKGKYISVKKINLTHFHKVINKKSSKKFLGGGAANTIRGINNLGLTCSLIGAVGGDKEGNEYINQLHIEGIKPYFIKVLKRNSSKCYVFITPDNERSFVIDKGVYANFPEIDLANKPFYNLFHTTGYELVSNPEKIFSFVESLKQKGTKLSFDLASEKIIPHNPDKIKEMISYSDIVFAGIEEINALGGLEKELIQKKIFILKKGKKGSEIYHKEKKINIPPVKVKNLVNTNGAGDSYAAGFLAAYMVEEDLKDCGDFASHIASRICSQEESWYK